MSPNLGGISTMSCQHRQSAWGHITHITSRLAPVGLQLQLAHVILGLRGAVAGGMICSRPHC